MMVQNICPINTRHFLWDAIVAWRDGVYNSDDWGATKSCYLISMLKLIEAGIINVHLELSYVDECWLKGCKRKVDKLPHWSEATKSIRKTSLNSLYRFIQTEFDRNVFPYQHHPEPNIIRHILSSTQEKALTTNISPSLLCNTLSKINERDAYIVWLMMHTGQRLEAVLDLRKEMRQRIPYLDFNNTSKHIPKHITDRIMELSKDSKVYLFETSAGKRITRVQVTRNLKNAGRNIGLTFDLTPKVLHGYVVAYMSRDKRSELEKSFFPLFK